MSISGVSRPPRPHRPPRLQPEVAPERPATGPPPRRRPPSHERILVWSLLVSLLIHLFVLVISPVFLRVGLPPGQPAEDVDRFARPEIRMIVPVPSEGADPEMPAVAPETPAVARSAFEPPRPATVPQTGDPAEAEPAPPVAGGEASSRSGLRIGPRDPRLWVNPREVPLPEKSDRERYMEHLQARVDAINDSIAGDAERARRATDWTVTDREGRRWGLSPEGLHIGGVTVPRELVPLPAPTGDNQALERQREEQRQREEIRRQEEARERRRQGGGGN